ncbi:hypothetical protein [Kitasatospora viridis]|uniref:Uncharacterized protein n=1 Tax=Kitasatospora viridis TaxID=281105 RepID=A0A561TTD8_9ACTN|nr:hypothetical protein [Kitasatospora viridis]TWF90386.1 hypothetical protein FHX73_13430 [Kitasatospora viridis]
MSWDWSPLDDIDPEVLAFLWADVDYHRNQRQFPDEHLLLLMHDEGYRLAVRASIVAHTNTVQRYGRVLDPFEAGAADTDPELPDR